MKSILFACFFLFSLSAGAVLSGDSSAKHQQRLFVRAFYNRTQSFLKMPESDGNITIARGRQPVRYNYKASDEMGTSGFQAGVLLELVLYKPLSISTGFTYERLSYQIKEGAQFRVDDSYYYANPKSYTSTTVQFDQSQTFISFPLLVNYTLSKRKLSFLLSGGMAIDLLSSFSNQKKEAFIAFNNHGYYYTTYNQKGKDENGAWTYRGSALFSAGIGYSVFPELIIGIMPSFKYYFANENSQLGALGYHREADFMSAGAGLFVRLGF